MRVLWLSDLVDRPSYRLYVRTIPLSSCMYRRSRYRGVLKNTPPTHQELLYHMEIQLICPKDSSNIYSSHRSSSIYFAPIVSSTAKRSLKPSASRKLLSIWGRHTRTHTHTKQAFLKSYEAFFEKFSKRVISPPPQATFYTKKGFPPAQV